MPIDREFLQLIQCPVTRKPLAELDAGALAALNGRIAKGGVKSRGGATVQAALQGALQPQGEAFVYPVQEGIPILLTTEAIELSPES
jgi:uncharacterized protein YbaR (Trm112 family)